MAQAGEHVQADVAFADLGAGQRQCAWGAIQREEAVQTEAPEVAAVAGTPAVVGGVGQRAAAGRLDRSPAFHRGGVHEKQVILTAGGVLGELGDQLLDDVRQALTALDVSRPLGQPREQVPKADRRGRCELLVRADAQQLLSDRQRDDFGVGHHSSGVRRPHGQEIVGGAEHRNEQQVEVGVHRGPQGRRWRMSTADFDPAAYVPCTTTGRLPAVERLI